MNGAELITAERERQIEKERFGPSHDDEHDMGELIGASMTYSAHALGIVTDHELPDSEGHDGYWPWDVEWWKPSPDPIRNLVKAGALIAAEIDRLKRLEKSDGKA